MRLVEKPIRLSEHAKGYRSRRGFSENDVIDSINTGRWQRAKSGRFEAEKEFVFNDSWNGVYYRRKKVRSIFVEEENEIVVITVYVYYY